MTESSMECKLRINGMVEDSIVDGPGLRLAVFVQGCPHHCPGCHNPQTHDFAGGRLIEDEEILGRLQRNPLTAGVTFSGGEPFCQPEALYRIGRGVRAMGKNIVCYSGYTLEQLLDLAKERPAILKLLQISELLVDGPYLEAERDLTLQYRGSANQRLLRLPDALPEELRQA